MNLYDFPRFVRLENIMPNGELKKRFELNLNRLEQPDYHFDFAVNQTPQAPGDYLGRTLLARMLLWKTLKEKPKSHNYERTKHRNEISTDEELEIKVLRRILR